MIERYEIKQQDTLYLYLSYEYEFSKEFFSNLNNNDIISKIKEYINNMKINFNGKKVVLVVGGLVLATVLLNNNQVLSSSDYNKYSSNQITNYISNVDENLLIKNSDQKDEFFFNSESEINNSQNNNQTNIPVENKKMITIYRSNGPKEIELEEYIIGVVAAEMPASFELESLKAQAVVARTYALRRIESNLKLTDKSDTQNYKDEQQLRQIFGNSYDKYINKIKTAVDITKGQVIKYQGLYIDALYHSTSNGKTESSINVWGNNVPYLQSVDSKYDLNATSYLKSESKELNNILALFGLTSLNNEDIEIVSRTVSGRVNQIKIKDKTYSGIDLRNMLNLRSTDFDINILDGNLLITTKGYGHGVGMSQYGANGMAKNGFNYEQIIKHYYLGVNIENN